jgi:alcohol dehydrogenase (cytochrome c)
MRHFKRQWLLCATLLCAVGLDIPAPAAEQARLPGAPGPAPSEAAPAAPASATLTAREITNYVPVTDAMLKAPKPEDWLMYRGNYAGWGYSPLDKINKANVRTLQLAWSRAMAPGDNEITPIVYNGVMYLANPNDVIQAIDAATGDLLWEYKHPLPPRDQLHNHQGEHKRSLALYGNFVVFVTFDNIVVGLDARTGKRVWATPRGGDGYVTNSSGVIVANGMIVAGSTANGYGGGYVSGHDARNGEELWRKEVIPHPGEPGDETWAGTPFESRWHTGVWGHITYDPDLDLVYYGSSGVAPASEAQRNAPGATMAGTDTRFAVHPKTGEIVWRHQTLPRDNWDQECTFEMMVINTAVNPDPNASGMMAINPDARKGPRKTITGIPCKTGIAWSFDAANGEFLWAKQTVQQNLVAAIGPKGQVTVNEDMVMKDVTKTYNICPTYEGGRDWPMGAYSPKTNVMFVPMSNLCIDVKTKPNMPTPAQGYNTAATARFPAGKDKIGRIDAISVETGKTVWSWETRVANYSPVLATAGGLLFNGGMDRYLRAHDVDTGNVLWQTRLPAQTVGGTISFSVGGRQYIAISAGGGALAALQVGMTPEADMTPGSNAIYVFALPQ